jgi:chromosome segregation ATPase
MKEALIKLGWPKVLTLAMSEDEQASLAKKEVEYLPCSREVKLLARMVPLAERVAELEAQKDAWRESAKEIAELRAQIVEEGKTYKTEIKNLGDAWVSNVDSIRAQYKEYLQPTEKNLEALKIGLEILARQKDDDNEDPKSRFNMVQP